MSMSADSLYYNTIDQIYHAEWAVGKLARFELLKQSISSLWPNGHSTQLIQVAGTSGKGSVCRYLEAGLGLRHVAGSLTSPHLYEYRERFSIQGQNPSRDDVVEVWEERIRPLCIARAGKGEAFVHGTAEITILIALALFEKHNVEWAAIETGVGGRYDQTTALPVEATVLTNVGADHEELLGKEVWQRTLDKVGICRKNIPFVTSAQGDETLRIIQDVCTYIHAPLSIVTSEDVAQTQQLVAKHAPATKLTMGLLSGTHQLLNATLALRVLTLLFPDIPADECVLAFSGVQFAGRFQEIRDRVFIDIAHNPDKIAALAQQAQERFPNARKIFVLGLSGKRDPQVVFAPVIAMADHLILTTAGYKGIPPETLESCIRELNTRDIPVEIISDPKDALTRSLELQTRTSIVILTGSTYMIDQALNPDPYMRNLNATFGWRNPPNPRP